MVKSENQPATTGKGKKKPDEIEKSWQAALADTLTNAQKLDIAKSFKEGRPVNIRGSIHVNGARLPFHVVMPPPKKKKKTDK
jgi:hypothetical protein